MNDLLPNPAGPDASDLLTVIEVATVANSLVITMTGNAEEVEDTMGDIELWEFLSDSIPLVEDGMRVEQVDYFAETNESVVVMSR